MKKPELAPLLGRLRDEAAELELLLAVGGPSSPALAEMHERVARSRSHALRAVVETVGWPDEMMGEEAPRAALDLLAAAPADPVFLRRCLQLARVATIEGRLPSWHPAVIEDLLALAEQGEQRYGTRLRWTGEGWEPYPLADPQGVDQRRQQVGLGPLHEVIRRFGQPGPTTEGGDADRENP